MQTQKILKYLEEKRKMSAQRPAFHDFNKSIIEISGVCFGSEI